MHGDFDQTPRNFKQTPSNHMVGHGCPRCKESLGEKVINEYLTAKNFVFKRQGKFDTCRKKKALAFDFVIKYKTIIVAIEFNGRQHYFPSSFRSKMLSETLNKKFSDIQDSDKIKNQWCVENKVPLLIISYKNKENIHQIIDKFFQDIDITKKEQHKLVAYKPIHKSYRSKIYESIETIL